MSIHGCFRGSMRGAVNCRSFCFTHCCRCKQHGNQVGQRSALIGPHKRLQNVQGHHFSSASYGGIGLRKYLLCPVQKSISKLQLNRINAALLRRDFCLTSVTMTTITVNDGVDLSNFANVTSLLDSVSEHVQRGDFTANNIVHYAQALHQLTYEGLNKFPWLHVHNSSIAYMQLLMNDMLGDTVGSIWKHPGFEEFLTVIKDSSPSLSSVDVVNILLALLWLGVDKTNSAVLALFLESHEHVEKLGLNGLVSLSDCLRALRRPDIILVGKATKRFADILEKTDALHLAEKDFITICRLGTNLWAYLSSPTTISLLSKTVEWLNTQNITNISSVSGYCRMIKRLMANQRSGLKECIQTDLLAQILDRHRDKLLPHHIAEIAHSLKTSGLYKTSIASILQESSLELLKSDRKFGVGRIVNTCYSFNRNCTDTDRRLVEDVIYRNMTDADVLVLSNLADILVDMDCRNQDIIQVFYSIVMKHLPHLLNFVTRLSKVLRFLNLSQCKNVHKDELYQAILQQLHQQQGLHIWSISNLASFLLRHVDHVIPELLYERLLAAIPQCDINELHPIMVGLSKVRYPRIRIMQSQIQKLQSLIFQNIRQKVDQISSLDMLHQMVVITCLRWQPLDVGLLDTLMDQYPKFTKKMSQGGFIKTLNNLNQLVYYSPRILEDLTQYAMTNHTNLGTDRFCYFVKTLANIGYVPQDAEDFTELCTRMFEESEDCLDVQNQIRYALDLAKLQIFPESLLNTIFTVEYIEEVDKYINGLL